MPHLDRRREHDHVLDRVEEDAGARRRERDAADRLLLAAVLDGHVAAAVM